MTDLALNAMALFNTLTEQLIAPNEDLDKALREIDEQNRKWGEAMHRLVTAQQKRRAESATEATNERVRSRSLVPRGRLGARHRARRGHGQDAPCWGPIARHEIVRRSQDKHAAVTPEVVIGLCAAHHALDEHRPAAIELGIRIDASSWQWHRADAFERTRLINQAAAWRRKARRSHGIAR